MNVTFRWVFIAPFGGPVVPEVYVKNATSSADRVGSGGRSPRWDSTSSRRSTVSSSRSRLDPSSRGGTWPSRQSSSDVVMAMSTSVFGTTAFATSRHSDSSVTSARAPESVRSVVSSRSLSIGLTDTIIPPAFQEASMVTTNCGTF